MRNEIQLINHYINSRNVNFLIDNGVDLSFFISTLNIVEWIEEYKGRNNSLPTIETVDSQFDDFEIIEDLDAVPFLVDELKNRFIWNIDPF